MGHEMDTSNFNIHPVMKAQALDQLVPDSFLQIIIGRPELSEYETKLRWVKAQIEHHRGTVHAQQTSNPKALNSVESGQRTACSGNYRNQHSNLGTPAIGKVGGDTPKHYSP